MTIAQYLNSVPTLAFDPGPVTVTPEARALCRADGIDPQSLVDEHVAGAWFRDLIRRSEARTALQRGGGSIISFYELTRGQIEVLTDIGEPLTIVRLAGSAELPRHREPRPAGPSRRLEVVR